MLVSKSKYSEGDIVSFKLVNGDEIVAKVVEQTDSKFVVSKPLTVIPQQKGLMLIQSLFSADIEDDIEIERSHVMLHTKSADEVNAYYIQTTTGIEAVPQSAIIT